MSPSSIALPYSRIPKSVPLLICVTSLLIPLAASPSRAEDNGNVYGFMRSEWDRSGGARQQRSLFAPFAARAPVAVAQPRRVFPTLRHFARTPTRQRFASLPTYSRKAPLAFSLKPKRRGGSSYSSYSTVVDEAEFFQVKGEVTYCVRLCDGFYRPLAYSKAASSEATKSCSDIWPAAETAIYKSWDLSAGIEAAHAGATKSGELYTALATAYGYRNEGGANDSCTREQRVERKREIWDDPTLRKGDIYVSQTGAVVFSGRRGPPFETADFSPMKTPASKLRKDLKLVIDGIKPAEDVDRNPTASIGAREAPRTQSSAAQPAPAEPAGSAPAEPGND